jgi:hypothetical protein
MNLDRKILCVGNHKLRILSFCLRYIISIYDFFILLFIGYVFIYRMVLFFIFGNDDCFGIEGSMMVVVSVSVMMMVVVVTVVVMAVMMMVMVMMFFFIFGLFGWLLIAFYLLTAFNLYFFLCT